MLSALDGTSRYRLWVFVAKLSLALPVSVAILNPISLCRGRFRRSAPAIARSPGWRPSLNATNTPFLSAWDEMTAFLALALLTGLTSLRLCRAFAGGAVDRDQ